MSSSDGQQVFYHYVPSFAAAVAFCALFLISTFLHFYQLIRTRTWYLIPLLLGGFCEWIGYIGRAWSSKEAPDYSLGPYIVQALLLLIAPVLFAASIYMELGHIILLADGEHASPIKKRYLTALFVLGDIFAFLVQSTGASTLTKKKPDAVKSGNYIIIGGLAIQLIFFGLFMLVSIIFHVRINKNPSRRSSSPNVPWLRHLIALYLSSILIMVRSVFRTVEYVQGTNGYLISHEVYLFVFDSALMFLTMALFNIIHPSEVKGMLRGRRAMRWGIMTTQMKKVDELEDIQPKEQQFVGSLGHNAV